LTSTPVRHSLAFTNSILAVKPMRTITFVLVLSAAGVAAEPSSSAEALAALKKELAAGTAIADLPGKPFASTALNKADAAAARDELWKAHVTAIRKDRADEVKNKMIADGKLEMPYSYKTFGKKPANGWSLWISMHGGGGAPKQVNDQQWENQKGLYKLDEGIYLAPRAPTNTWNLWHEGHIDRMFARLIEDLIVHAEVDPDRVYIMGYSAGGDGVYQLAPRMADHLAAAAMMAGHPNDASPLGLRNLPFALQVGGKDAAYNRNKVAAEWGQKLDELRKADPGGYEHFVKIHEDKAHWMNLEDKVALPWMAKFKRNPTPDRVVWKQAGTTHDRFYWLAVPPGEAKPGALVDVKRDKQVIEILSAEKVSRLVIRLDDRLVDLDQPVKVVHKGKPLFEGRIPRTAGALAKSLAGRGDPKLMFDAEVTVDLP
jgi:predicted esterase